MKLIKLHFFPGGKKQEVFHRLHKSSLRILVLPSCYPEEDTPLNRIFFKEQAVALHRHGIRADVVYVEARLLRNFALMKLKGNHFQVAETAEDGVLTVRMKGWNTLTQTLPGALLWTLLTLVLVMRYCSRHGKPDVIHAHEALWAGYAAYIISKWFNIPYVVTEHSSLFITKKLPRFTSPFLRKAFGNANKVVTVSSSLGISLNCYLNGKKPTIIPNIVDTSFFTLPKARKADDKFIFLAVGNLVPIKRHDFLIQAFAKEFKCIPNVYLEIGGSGPELNRLIELSNDLGVAERVIFLGSLNRVDVRNSMWRADAFVHSSKVETFGVVLVEALATGLTIISTNCGGPADIVINGVGFLVSLDDNDAFAVCMKKVWSEKISDPFECRKHALEYFSSSSVSKKLFNIYEEIAFDSEC